ncbi:MAG: Gfo/Idh/MocA family oxidoreductase [Propionibacteriaceae bacterium]|jgi:predicted dehydrogenase|nr:Gfo/Idh/MocA family oxidoreductase [Propionibacteriaceae bacterium]
MKRYAVVGTGHRCQMFLDAIGSDHRDEATLAALIDTNPGRIAVHLDRMAEEFGVDPASIATGGPEDLEKIIAEQKIDRVIVTTPDYTHADIIVRSLEAGADVVSEKPLTIDAASAQAIAEAVERTGRDVVVTFNYRYSPRNSALKEVIQSGEIGQVTSVAFEWVLDTAHGADYFRRWHRDKKNSGGLLIHKASHHFDLVNWWIDDVPARVYAAGGVKFYGAENADARGLGPRSPRGTHDGPHSPYELDLRTDPRLEKLYLEQEHYDGYLRDQDVFAPGVTTEDNLSVVVTYAGGPSLSYSLNAHSPWEGYRVAVNGTEGRAELTVVERSGVLFADDHVTVLDPSFTADESADPLRPTGERLLVQKHFGRAEERAITAVGPGGHGGGDRLLLQDVFAGPGEDPLGRPSDWGDGVNAIAVGICGNVSLAEGRPVTPEELSLPIRR